MNSLFRSTIFTLAFATALMGGRAFAKEIDIAGTHSKDEIRNACNAVGGDLLGVSDSGSYGCENSNKGTLVLCNKHGKGTALRLRSGKVSLAPIRRNHRRPSHTFVAVAPFGASINFAQCVTANDFPLA